MLIPLSQGSALSVPKENEMTQAIEEKGGDSTEPVSFPKIISVRSGDANPDRSGVVIIVPVLRDSDRGALKHAWGERGFEPPDGVLSI
jgi:hypothetical protein